MSEEGLKKGTFLQHFGTGSVESYAHTRPGGGSFYILVNEVVDGFPRVFQVNWDPVDYMAVTRNINPMNDADHDHHYHYFLRMETVVRVGQKLLLARRGQNNLDWQSHGTVRKIVFDEITFDPPRVPRALEADAYPSPTPG